MLWHASTWTTTLHQSYSYSGPSFMATSRTLILETPERLPQETENLLASILQALALWLFFECPHLNTRAISIVGVHTPWTLKHYCSMYDCILNPSFLAVPRAFTQHTSVCGHCIVACASDTGTTTTENVTASWTQFQEGAPQS